MSNKTTPEQAREFADSLYGAGAPDDEVDVIRSLADQVDALTTERDAARLYATTNELMAGCTDLLSTDLIEAGVVDASVPPMMLTEAIMRYVQTLTSERDEADRRAGAAERQLAEKSETLYRLNHCRDNQKVAAGFDRNVSFDVVWASVLADAERYRWLRTQHWNDGPMCIVMKPKDFLKLGSYCPSLDLLDGSIDAARAAS